MEDDGRCSMALFHAAHLARLLATCSCVALSAEATLDLRLLSTASSLAALARSSLSIAAAARCSASSCAALAAATSSLRVRSAASARVLA